jgi:hypothetical protein
MTESNVETPMRDRDDKGQFLLGHTGRGGRPRGSRSKLAGEFIDALCADFEQHGTEVITKVRKEKPDVYLKVVANLMPAKLEASLTQVSIFQHYNLQDPRDFAQAWEIARKVVYGEVPGFAEQEAIEIDRRDAEHDD